MAKYRDEVTDLIDDYTSQLPCSSYYDYYDDETDLYDLDARHEPGVSKTAT